MNDQILSIINTDPLDISRLKTLFFDKNIADIAEVFKELHKEKIIQLFRILPKTIAAEVFAHVDSDQQKIIVEALTDTEIGEIMSKLFVDDAVDFIEEMPANVVKRVLRNVNEDKRRVINQLLQYPDDSAGSIMTTEYVELQENDTVSQAFDYIRSTGVNKETIYTCYVIRHDRILIGVVTAKTLMLSSQQDRIGDIMDTNFICAGTTDDQEEIAALFKKYGLLSLPIADKEGHLVGIVTVDDIVQVIQDENTEDVEKMAALNPSDESYLKTGVFKQSRNRIFWLMFLMLSASITGTIISRFENALTALPMLIAFIPMLMNTCGNAGCQTSALIIRGIALGEIRFRSIVTVLWREIQVAFLCGLALAAVNFIRVYFMHGRDLMLCITVSLSLIATVIASKSIGCILPLIAQKIKLDPAIMAAPLITTIADASSLIVYFSIASIVLSI